ncbi:MAG: hypothetical protein K2J16_00565 [Clostridia bacterium]|nr:hypothetical protein [Clostridia bacterium]
MAQFCVSSGNSVNIAKADSTVTVIKAPVSNLEDNAYAGKSTIMVFDKNNIQFFYIPESYYLCSPVDPNANSPFESTHSIYYDINYCDIGDTFCLCNTDLHTPYELPATTQITVSEGESLFPDVRLTLKGDEEVELGSSIITNDFTIKLLGYNEDGSEVYASATYNGISKYGFIPVDSLEPFTVPYQQRAQTERDTLLAAKNKPVLPNGSFTPPDNSSVALRVVLVIGIAIPSIIIVLLLFKPSKDEKRYAKTSVRRERNDRIDYDEPRDSRRHSNYHYEYDDEREYDRGYSRRDRDYDRRDDYDRGYDRDDRYNRPRRDYDERY